MVGFGFEGGREKESAGKEVKLKAPQKEHEAPEVGKKKFFFLIFTIRTLNPAGQCTKHSVSLLAFVLLVQRKITGGKKSHHG